MATNIKTIIIFLLLSFGVYAQGQIWWIDTTSAGTEKRVYLGDYNKGYTAGGINMGRLPIADIAQSSFTLPTGLTGAFAYASGLDSIKGNDTATMNFANQFRSSFIVLQDTNVYLTQTDSVIVECYHTQLGTWSSKAVGLYREYDGLITGADVVIPGQGLTKKYWLLDEYISQVRVRWYYGANKGTRKVNIVFYGAN